MHSRRFRFLSGLVVTVAALAVAVGAAMPAAAAPDDGQWDPTLPKLLSAGAPGDPLAIANASLAASAQATEATMDLGRKFLSTLGFGPARRGGRRGAGPGARPAGHRVRHPSGRVADGCAVFMGRWQAQRTRAPASTPVPTSVGFDCSGFTQFSFAGVGVLIPKYSGDQYDTGRKVPTNQAKRGDLLFWGPGGSQHVAIYLGGGQMLEASGGSAARSPSARCGDRGSAAVRGANYRNLSVRLS